MLSIHPAAAHYHRSALGKPRTAYGSTAFRSSSEEASDSGGRGGGSSGSGGSSSGSGSSDDSRHPSSELDDGEIEQLQGCDITARANKIEIRLK